MLDDAEWERLSRLLDAFLVDVADSLTSLAAAAEDAYGSFEGTDAARAVFADLWTRPLATIQEITERTNALTIEIDRQFAPE
jgi:hypothetical protein